MFSEKNLPKLIIFTPIITVILIAFFTLYFFVKNQNDYFEEESVRVETEYISKQKNILKKEINYIINYIEYHVSKNKSLNENKLEEDKLKDDILKYIETIRYGKHGYIWVHDTNYHLKAHPFRQEKVDTLDIDLKDAMGTLITKEFIEQTIKHPKGHFIEYYWQKPKELHASMKLGFFKLYEKYNWVIGTGLYIDDIQKTIFENKKLLEDKIDKYIQTVLVFSFFIILIIGLISFLISREITQVFKKYQDSVQKKELLLEDLNKNLEEKVENAIKEVKKKDRAMFHQSRLARMGTMLSMIAHQWRQPLSEVSGILMELETANKFNKVDTKMIKASIKDSNKLISFMSNTIDDFRNFFKPDKQKVEFYIDDACNEAITLVDAAIKNFDIKLIKEVKNNVLIKGYNREFAQVMLNLISNAKDALVQREITNPYIKITLFSKDKNVIITVEDNAEGIKEEHMSNIFDPYFTTKEGLKGTGLGLYMSKMIIENNMNGELFFVNTKKGALFTIILEA